MKQRMHVSCMSEQPRGLAEEDGARRRDESLLRRFWGPARCRVGLLTGNSDTHLRLNLLCIPQLMKSVGNSKSI